MSKAPWIIALAVLALACGDKKSEGVAPSAVGSAATNTPGSGAAVADKPATRPDGGSAAAGPYCDCRMLTTSSLADLEGGAFGEKCEGLKLISGSGCDQFDVLRNCIYAAHGNKFKTKKWHEDFAGRDWYAPRDDFKPGDLSKLELANVRALKQRSADCRAESGGKVTEADIMAVKAWWKIRAKKIPAHVWFEGDEGPSSDPQEIIEARLGNLKLDASTRYYYGARPDSDGLDKVLAGKEYRVVVVASCYECETGDEDCESSCDTFEVMVGDKGEIIALYLTVAAACPFVYVASGGEQFAGQGEILRHLDAPALEGRQRLELDASCGGPITVRVSEEKPEVTFLDEIFLEIDGVRHDAIGCGDAAHCADDGSYARLSPGETLELVFDVESGRCDRVELVADGFYMPL